MKKTNKIIIFILILVSLFNTQAYAHGGNITGWNKKDSTEITEHDGKYYGYHKQNKVKHYHQVEWNEEEKKWQIIKSAVCYDENFNIINAIDDSNASKIEVKYSKSVDGDTAKFELNGEEITVRFLGIDTPETIHPTKGEEPFGREASNYTKQKLENADKIEIEYDQNASKTDKYERALVWVWVDDTLIQEELIKNGLARTYMLQDNYKYAWILQEDEEKAKEEKVGIWSEENKTQENIPAEKIESEDNASNFVRLLSIIITLIVAILFGKIKQKRKK